MEHKMDFEDLAAKLNHSAESVTHLSLNFSPALSSEHQLQLTILLISLGFNIVLEGGLIETKVEARKG